MKIEENTAKIFRDDGAAFQRWGNLEEAEQCFLKALDCRDGHKDHETLFRMAELFLEKKDPRVALGYYILVIHADAGNHFYKQRFLDAAGKVSFSHYDSDVEDAILQCLKTPGIDLSNAGVLWSTILRTNPDFARLYEDRQAFEKKFDPSPLFHPYFIEGLKKITTHEQGFEDFIRRLRQWLLMGLSSPGKMPAREDYLRLAEAVAVYCFYGDYIIRVTAPEKAKLRETAGQLADPLFAAVRACYGFEDIPAVFETGSALDIILKENEQIKAGDSTVAKKSPEQLPYPRWRSVPLHTLRAGSFFPPRREKMEKTFAGYASEILVAGCGTGREALVAALYYPRGKVTGIDPCGKNIAYAALKSREHNISNITFKQDDIANLEKASKPYDIIYTSGVLHHRPEPLKAWQILWNCLKPAGIMRVGLYSKTARRHVAAAREVAGKLNIGNNRESLLDFRTRSAEFLPPDVLPPLAAAPDYYGASTYENLLFQDVEHSYTLQEIEEMLAKLRLTFVGFDLPGDILRQYGAKFPDDREMVSLKNWHEFEQEAPDTFANGAYQFWCRKF